MTFLLLFQPLSHVSLFATPYAVLSYSVSDSATPRTIAHQAPLSVGILQAGILEWVAMPWPPPGDLPNPGIKPRSPASFLVHSLPSEPPGKPPVPMSSTISQSLLQFLSLSQWYSRTISFSAALFSFCLQSFPASGFGFVLFFQWWLITQVANILELQKQSFQ